VTKWTNTYPYDECPRCDGAGCPLCDDDPGNKADWYYDSCCDCVLDECDCDEYEDCDR